MTRAKYQKGQMMVNIFLCRQKHPNRKELYNLISLKFCVLCKPGTSNWSTSCCLGKPLGKKRKILISICSTLLSLYFQIIWLSFKIFPYHLIWAIVKMRMPSWLICLGMILREFSKLDFIEFLIRKFYRLWS